MFDFDAGKLLFIAIVALIFIGPKELPNVLRNAGRWAAHLRRMIAEMQAQFTEAIRDSEFENIRDDLVQVREITRLGSSLNPLTHVKNALHESMIQRPSASPVLTPSLPEPKLSDQIPSLSEPVAIVGKPRLRLRADAVPSQDEAPPLA